MYRIKKKIIVKNWKNSPHPLVAKMAETDSDAYDKNIALFATDEYGEEDLRTIIQFCILENIHLLDAIMSIVEFKKG